jgi:hypothetical protein
LTKQNKKEEVSEIPKRLTKMWEVEAKVGKLPPVKVKAKPPTAPIGGTRVK